MSTGPDAVSRSRRGAFTMLELVIALAIFGIIAGALFRVIEACLQTTAELHDAQRFTRQVATLTELCRKGFTTLPGDATFVCPMSEEVDGQEIVFRNAPMLFSWGATPMNFGTTTLAVRPQEDGRFSFALSRSDFKPPEEEAEAAGQTEAAAEFEPDEEGRYWLPLISDLEWARWRFYDPAIKEWQEAWPHTRRPPMVELTLLLAGDTVPYRVVFSVASTTAAAAAATTPLPAAPATPPAGGRRRP